MIDTHSHLNFTAFQDDWQEVVERAIQNGVTKILVVGTDIATSQRAVEMAQHHPALYAVVGIHPHHAKKYIKPRGEVLGGLGERENKEQINRDLEVLETLIKQPRVVGVGEIGLDYHIYTKSKYVKGDQIVSSMTSPAFAEATAGRSNDPLNDVTEETIEPELVKMQRQLFQAQLELAQKYDKPVVVHSRKAKEEVLEMIIASNHHENEIITLRRAQAFGSETQARRGKLSRNDEDAIIKNKLRGVFHCFEGGKKMAKRVIEAGFLISFTGNITYDHGRAEVSKTIPLERLMLETDCPYMTPVPERGTILRSEPRHVKIIGQFHADLRDVTAQEVDKQTTENAEKLFGI